MTWENTLIKEETAKDFVLNNATKGMTMEEAVKLFAEKFPDKMPPNIDEQIDNAKKLDAVFINLEQSRLAYEATKNLQNPYR